MKLLIISHTAHYKKDESYVGWGSTIREINHLARLFDKVVHLAPLHKKDAPGSSLPYTANNFRYAPVTPAGGNSLREKLTILRSIPGWLSSMKREMGGADILHIRCPAGISLLALIAARLWFKDKPIWVKYGGSWASYPEQPLTYKIQRWYLKNNFHHGIVTVNGHWRDQPDHVCTFQNPAYSYEEYQSAVLSASKKRLCFPVNLIFVGRLDDAKGVDRILRIAKKMYEEEIDFRLTCVGDGKKRQEYIAFVQKHGMENIFYFAGWQPRTKLPTYYEKAHLFLFPSITEGWPKVLSEAMAYGVVPVASSVGSIPEILAKTGAGVSIDSGSAEEYIKAIKTFCYNPLLWKKSSENGTQAASKFTYENYLQAIKEKIFFNWNIELNYETQVQNNE